MAGVSNIEWTEHTWNPFAGCAVLTPGCTNCYAMKMAARLDAMGQSLYKGLTKPSKAGAVWRGTIRRANDDVLLAPLRRKKPTTYFVNSMSDLFYETFPDEWIDQVFAVMALSPEHTFQVLTKRAERMREYMTHPDLQERLIEQCREAYAKSAMRFYPVGVFNGLDVDIVEFRQWPLPNCWLGVSAERQQEADERIPLLLQTPAAVRFVSAEPLLEAIDLKHLAAPRVIKGRSYDEYLDALLGERCSLDTGCMTKDDEPALDWVIVGGESGPNAREFDLAWGRSLIDQCRGAGVKCFMKQLGAKVRGPHANGTNQTRYSFKSAKGGDWSEWPDDLRVREFPVTSQSRSEAA